MLARARARASPPLTARTATHCSLSFLAHNPTQGYVALEQQDKESGAMQSPGHAEGAHTPRTLASPSRKQPDG